MKCWGRGYWECVTGRPSEVFLHGCELVAAGGLAAALAGVISAGAAVTVALWAAGAFLALCVLCIFVGDVEAMMKLYWGDYYD